MMLLPAWKRGVLSTGWHRTATIIAMATAAVVSAFHATEAQEAAANQAASSPASTSDLFWCDSTNAAKLDCVVTREGDRYLMSNVAKYNPPDKNCYYYVNWDLLGTQQAGKPIREVEVEPNSLYLVHLYEVSKSKTLADFWSDEPGKEACSAIVWVGGTQVESPSVKATGVTGVLDEIRESPRWFHYDKGDRLPRFAQRFPEFQLPAGKVLSLNLFSTQDPAESYLKHGVTHIAGPGKDREHLRPAQRLICLGADYLNGEIGEKPSANPHISPTEKAFMETDLSYVARKAKVVADYDYVFLDQEFWHSDYQPATLERLCALAQEARKVNPAIKLADFWNPPPYRFNFLFRDGPWTIDSVRAEALSHYDSVEAALKSASPTMLKQVSVQGTPTCLANELTAVSQCVYFDNLFGFIDQYATFSIDTFVPAAIHSTRVNKRLECNRGKPIIWFGMDILEGNYNHPRIAYSTRTTDPPGTAMFKDRLLVSPNYNEALALFGLLEGDGIYLWDAHGTSDGDPNGIFGTLQYCVDYKDNRGEWRPDKPGAPLGSKRGWYPYAMAYAADYYALGAWKYAQIADVVAKGRRVDFEYSLDDGRTWYTPPANGGAMVDVIHDKRPIVTGAVSGQDIAVVVFHPFQGVADKATLRVRQGKDVFAVTVTGTRARVFRGKLSPG